MPPKKPDSLGWASLTAACGLPKAEYVHWLCPLLPAIIQNTGLEPQGHKQTIQTNRLAAPQSLQMLTMTGQAQWGAFVICPLGHIWCYCISCLLLEEHVHLLVDDMAVYQIPRKLFCYLIINPVPFLLSKLITVS